LGKRYEKEFKIEAVRLASEPGDTQAKVKRDLGIGLHMLRRSTWTGIVLLYPEDHHGSGARYGYK
jgi:transposase-like protein